jgi:alkylation response protein AidB-like acyl-CoA dehydrogenase
MMRFLPTDDQLAFAEGVDDVVNGHGGTEVVRAWAQGDTGPGVELWQAMSEFGLGGLRLAEDEGGLGASVADAVIVFERLGYHAVPGPYIESMVLLPALLGPEDRAELLGGSMATASVEGLVPYATDATLAARRFVVTGRTIAEAPEPTETIESMSSLRRLSFLTADPATQRGLDPGVVSQAVDESVLACAAYLLGAGERLLDEAVAYAKVREQFGHAIGEFQALKHQLADVKVGLAFAQPLVRGAALAIDTATRSRDVSAAKLAATQAAQGAGRVALQVHGAIGYTAEHHMGQWLTLVSALAPVWGTPRFHRDRVATTILARA